MAVALKDRPNLTFRVPDGVKLATWSGNVTDAFKPDQVPGASGPTIGGGGGGESDTGGVTASSGGTGNRCGTAAWADYISAPCPLNQTRSTSRSSSPWRC